MILSEKNSAHMSNLTSCPNPKYFQSHLPQHQCLVMPAKTKKPKRKGIHRQILERARIPTECIEAATARPPPEANPVGRASAKLFDSIANRRPYDAYCRPVPKQDNEDEGNSRGVFQQITVRPAHRPLHEIRSEAEARIDAIRRKEGGDLANLPSSSTGIGYEPTQHGPPGFRPPIKGILKSHGNERYFQNCE